MDPSAYAQFNMGLTDVNTSQTIGFSKPSHGQVNFNTYLKILGIHESVVSTYPDFKMMDTLTTHPSTAQQAKAFTSPSSLSFPGGAAALTPPPSEPEALKATNGPSQKTFGSANGTTLVGSETEAPATPAATPGAGPTVSGIVPTLQ